MPITHDPLILDTDDSHRPCLPVNPCPLPCLVARPVSKSEIRDREADGDMRPREALNDEWAAHRDEGTWDEGSPQ